MRNGAIIGLIGAILTLLISIIKFYEVYPIFNDLNFNSFDIQALNGLGKNLVLVPLGLFSGVLGLLGGKIGGKRGATLFVISASLSFMICNSMYRGAGIIPFTFLVLGVIGEYRKKAFSILKTKFILLFLIIFVFSFSITIL